MNKKIYNFKDIFLDDSKNVSKINLEEITNIGDIAVIDQSRTYIAGYVEESSYKVCKNERIIFGDHTRIIKYINIPFIIGADGVKTLKLKDEKKCLYKFFYYYLQYIDIPNNGYSRHFKFLKEKEFTIPQIEFQEKVIENLDKIEKLINDKKTQKEKFKDLIISKFIDMFQNRNYNVDILDNVSKSISAGGDKGKDISKNKDSEHIYPVYANGLENDGLQGYSKKYKIDEDAVTISARGTVGHSLIRKAKFTPVVRLITIVPNEKINVIYLKYAIDNMNLSSSGTSQAQIIVPNIKNEKLIVPPIELQNKFAIFVKQINKQELICDQQLNKLYELKYSKMQEYFGGVINE